MLLAKLLRMLSALNEFLLWLCLILTLLWLLLPFLVLLPTCVQRQTHKMLMQIELSVSVCVCVCFVCVFAENESTSDIPISIEQLLMRAEKQGKENCASLWANSTLATFTKAGSCLSPIPNANSIQTYTQTHTHWAAEVRPSWIFKCGELFRF